MLIYTVLLKQHFFIFAAASKSVHCFVVKIFNAQCTAKVQCVSSYCLEHLTFFLCRRKWVDEENPVPQTLHLKGLIPVCLCKWFFRLLGWWNPYPHTEHLYGFSPVCVLTCLLSEKEVEKQASHWLHLCGFSPVCVLICTVKSLAWAYADPHSWQR